MRAGLIAPNSLWSYNRNPRSASAYSPSVLGAAELPLTGGVAMANLSGKAKRVSIWVNEGDLVGHQPAPLAVLEFLRRENTAGATVFRGIEGFGGSGEIHTSRFVDVHSKLPIRSEEHTSELQS